MTNDDVTVARTGIQFRITPRCFDHLSLLLDRKIGPLETGVNVATVQVQHFVVAGACKQHFGNATTYSPDGPGVRKIVHTSTSPLCEVNTAPPRCLEHNSQIYHTWRT